MRRVSFKTVGCRLNRAETAALAALMQAHGWQTVPFGEACELTVIHTCAVTAKAEQTCSRFARLAKRINPDAVVILAGCAAQINGAELLKRTGADIAAGRDDKWRLPALIAHKFPGTGMVTGPNPLPVFDTRRATIRAQDGCDFSCAYCVVPSARGASRSRSIAEIKEETRRLADLGYAEFVLSGANLGCYSDGSRGLVDLLEEMERLPGVARIRISSIEFSTVERAIVEYMASSRKLCRFLHVPLQSGDNRILAAMKRRYKAEAFRRFADFAAERVPMLGLGTDVIVGFPGEDDEAFRNTMETVSALPFSNVHVFPYSRRPGTVAATMTPAVPRLEITRRTKELITLALKKRSDFASRFPGRRVSVLIETLRGRTGSGWTSEYLECRVDGDGVRQNTIVDAMVLRAEGSRLIASMQGVA